MPLPFDYQPVLRGDLVTLRPLLPSDYDVLYAVAVDPLIWEQHPDKTRHQPTGFQAFFQEALVSGGALIASEASTGQVIGSSRFHAYDQDLDEVEIGWTFLARAYWGGRYNGEMKHHASACFPLRPSRRISRGPGEYTVAAGGGADRCRPSGPQARWHRQGEPGIRHHCRLPSWAVKQVLLGAWYPGKAAAPIPNPCRRTDSILVSSVHRSELPMPKTRSRPGRPITRKGKVRKEFWLDPKLLREAQEYLGTATERETVELALDLVAFRRELRAGAQALRSLRLARLD